MLIRFACVLNTILFNSVLFVIDDKLVTMVPFVVVVVLLLLLVFLFSCGSSQGTLVLPVGRCVSVSQFS